MKKTSTSLNQEVVQLSLRKGLGHTELGARMCPQHMTLSAGKEERVGVCVGHALAFNLNQGTQAHCRETRIVFL